MLTRPRAVSLAASCAIAALTGCTDLGQHGFGGAAATRDANSVLSIVTGPSPQEAAAWMIDAYDADKRYRGTLLIANAPWGGGPQYLSIYRAKLNPEMKHESGLSLYDEDPLGRAAAVRGLALHGSPEDVPVIVTQIKSENEHLRWECVRALQRLHNPVAIRPLLIRLDESEEDNPDIRADAATALGQYAENRVLDGLFAALNDRDLAVNTAALNSLRTLTGQDLGFNRRQWVVWAGQTEAHFAGRTPYEYPVFHRDPGILEIIVPWMHVPNEVAAAPVGMTAQSADTGS
ncbi:MAG: HEAT repeat domain-containing protein [Phycisphaerales bacterium]|nr:HEAT repeat domain-containing protein [Phycisphaerales bacterium]